LPDSSVDVVVYLVEDPFDIVLDII